MEERRGFQDKRRYVLSIIIGTVIFFLVFGITYSISYFEFQRVSTQQNALAYQIFQDKLDYSFFNKSICMNESFQSISQDLAFQGTIMDDLEKKFGKNNADVLSRKEFYSLIELEHLEFIDSKIQKCGFHINIIMFFYSNSPGDLTRSEDTGKMLDNLYNMNPSNLIIYSFDINLNTDLINNLLSKYDIKSSPTIVVNEKTVVVNPQTINDVEKYLT
jgi:hypothetical protein